MSSFANTISRNMATKEITIKLMLDPESKRLIFAEASKDFIDFLIFILSLPIGTVTKLLSSESMVGSIGNIYTGVFDLIRNIDTVDEIRYPMFCSSLTDIPLRETTASIINAYRIFYSCVNLECSVVSNLSYETCPCCHGDMLHEIHFVNKDRNGYVRNEASYMVSDDLSITPISTMSVVAMLNKFDVTKRELEERDVKIGAEEALELLKASLESTTVLTEVFLKKKYKKQPGNGRSTMEIVVKTLTGKKTSFQVEPSETIYSVQTKYQDIDGTLRKEMRLLYNGRLLEERRTVADYNIVNKSELHCVLRLRGC